MSDRPFLSVGEILRLLESRGMLVKDRESAYQFLLKVSYIRLSEYCYPLRKFHSGSASVRADEFQDGVTFDHATGLYEFDAKLKSAVFATLVPIEIAMRARLASHLGELDCAAHLNQSILNARARGPAYATWRRQYERLVRDSREEFVINHLREDSSSLPVWVAIEILSWGGMVQLYGFCPRTIQDDIAADYGLTAPQLESWLRTLNIVRNICAHHGRLFNRVLSLSPKVPKRGNCPELESVGRFTRAFGQLSMIQFMLKKDKLSDTSLPSVMATYPAVPAVPISHTGAPVRWEKNPLWALSS